MANNIALSKNYITILDAVYKKASLTSVLDSDPGTAQQGNRANEIVIPKLSMDGLADYSRNGGYVGGNVNLTHETVTFNYDRGRKFSINSIPVFCTYSPEDLVKDRSLRAPIWEDLQLISAFLKENQEK